MAILGWKCKSCGITNDFMRECCLHCKTQKPQECNSSYDATIDFERSADCIDFENSCCCGEG